MRRWSLPISDIEAPDMARFGTGRKASTGSRSSPATRAPTCAHWPAGDPDDSHSRYIEAEVDGVIVASTICPTAIRSGPRSSITSSAGWSGCVSTRPSCLRRAAGRAGRRLQRRPRRSRRLSVKATQHDALLQPETRAEWRQLTRQAGPTPARVPSAGRQALHLWGLHRGLLAARCRLPNRHLLARPKRRTGCATRVSTAGPGRRKSVRHAPTWVELS